MERALVKRIGDWLKSHEDIYYLKIHGGLYQRPGVPDFVIGCRGLFIGIEVKSSIGKLTKIQEMELGKIQRAGCHAYVVRSWDEFMVVMNSIHGIDEESFMKPLDL